MSKIDYEQKVAEIMTSHFSDFDAIEDIETLSMQERLCIVRTTKLMPTLLFMQISWRRLWELQPDDSEWIEANILTYYKPKNI